MATQKTSTEPVHTAFLRNVILSSGVTIQDLAKRINLTTTSVHHWFQCDDIRLSKVIQVARVLGYDLQVSIDKKPYQLGKSEPSYFSFNEMEKLSLKNLYFLKHAIKESGITKYELAARLGITKEAITYWYVADDITLRRLTACANILGRDLYFRFVKDESTAYAEEGTGIHLDIQNIQSWIDDCDYRKRPNGD